MRGRAWRARVGAQKNKTKLEAAKARRAEKKAEKKAERSGAGGAG
jgi:hypothetical protein